MRRVVPLTLSALALSLATFAVHAAPADDWVLRYDGVGPLRIGMSFDQVNAAVGGVLQRTPAERLPTAGCEQIAVPGHRGVVLMITNDGLERIDFLEPGAATMAGVAVGAPVAQVLAAYPHIDHKVHAYDGAEQYLTLQQPGTTTAAQTGLAMRFVTAKGKVGEVIAGRLREVSYIEGCL
jgi:hypothetical protein